MDDDINLDLVTELRELRRNAQGRSVRALISFACHSASCSVQLCQISIWEGGTIRRQNLSKPRQMPALLDTDDAHGV
jgi:hypothetical protein